MEYGILFLILGVILGIQAVSLGGFCWIALKPRPSKTAA
jgi:hypothetical protein